MIYSSVALLARVKWTTAYKIRMAIKAREYLKVEVKSIKKKKQYVYVDRAEANRLLWELDLPSHLQ